MRHQCYRTYPEFLQKIEELDRWLKKIACALRNLSVAKEPDQTQAIRLWMSHSATHKLWDTWKCQQLQMHSTCCWRDYYMLQMVVEFMTLTQNQMKHLVNVQP